ncbi:uncharacterized protein LOC131187272 [Ahaetulla prasina]|uniref:uncharacterized protein LOC131187272 n=1 Tax=Ahaetulla prasina TaxID=499056 RepID=UPI00264844A4|nr:uncharacterized protein LOC131187272 [Ahaetulla prasina]
MQGSGSWSPDRDSPLPMGQAGSTPLFRTLSELELQSYTEVPPAQPAGVSQEVGPPVQLTEARLPQMPVFQLPESFGLMIRQAIRQELAHSLHREAAPSSSTKSHSGKKRGDTPSSAPPRASPQREKSIEEGSLASVSEEEDAGDNLSEDEGLGPDQPSFVGLFKPHLFRSLLFKALATTGLGGSAAPSADPLALPSTSTNLFVEPTVPAETIPAPKMFVDVVQRQWSHPSSGSNPNATDKKFYNCAPDLENILQVPTVDAPIVALTTSSHVTGPENEALRPEDKRADQSLVKSHQASAWAVRSSIASSFFNRAAIMWLKQHQSRLPTSDVRAHQDLNKVIAALEFSADSTLNAARFSAKSIGSTVTSRRLLWLRHWRADTRNKWRLASSPYAGSHLFGASLDPILVETKDKKKVLPSLSRRGDLRQQPYFRPSPSQASSSSSSFRAQEFGGSGFRRQRFPPFRGSSQRNDQSASSMVPLATPEETVQFFQATGESSTGGSRLVGLVDSRGGSQGLGLQGPSEGRDYHRCQSVGLGSTSRATPSPGHVVPRGSQSWHQLSGAARHPSGTSGIQGSYPRQECPRSHGQHDGESAYKQVGWHSLSQVDDRNSLPRSLGRVPPAVVEGRTYRGDGQLQSGLPQPSDYQPGRMVLVPSEFPRVIVPFRASPSGLVLLRNEQSSASVFFEVPLAWSGVSGCPPQQLALGPPICLPTDSTDSQSNKEAPHGEGRVNLGRPLLAQETLVCGSNDSLNPGTMENPGRPGVTQPGTNPTSRTAVATLSRVEIERSILTKARVPPQAVPTMLASRRDSTKRIYEATWRTFDSWCSSQNLVSSMASVLDILAFLQRGLDSGLATNTLRRQIAALSSVLRCGSLLPLSKEPLIQQFLRGATNVNPPVVHRFPSWRLNAVLNALTKTPFEPLRDSSLRFLSLKVAFLIAITSARRISELSALSIRQDLCSFFNDRVVLRLDPTFLPKVNSQFHRAQEVVLPNFCPNPKHHLEKVWHTLDVRRALKIYIDRTSTFRKTEALFVSFQPLSLGQKVTKSVLARWIRAAIATAYESQSLPVPRNITAHSTRSAASSAAWSAQASIDEICRVATWSTPSSFVRHYKVDSYASADAAFGRRVLQTVLSHQQ